MDLSNMKLNEKTLIDLRGSVLDRIILLELDKRRISNLLPESLDDQAITNENDEVVEKLDEKARADLENIDAALRRIETGIFGVCAVCGDEIEEKRLKAVPYARNCIDCESEN